MDAHRPTTGLSRADAVSIIVVVGVLVLLALLPAMPTLRPCSPRRAACSSRLRTWYTALRHYVNAYDEFLPRAWHVAGPSVARDLGNLTYYRFLIQAHCEASFLRTVSPEELATFRGDWLKAWQGKLERSSLFWKCPAKGWTSDHFAPDLIFRWPAGSDGPGTQPATFSSLTADVPSFERPLFAEVNASLPDPDAKDTDDPEHEAEMRKGFSFVRESGLDIFVGVGPSLRRPGDLSSSRFDFRHNGAANVVFLDGHVEMVSKTNAERLERIHRAWNSLAGGEAKPGATSNPPK